MNRPRMPAAPDARDTSERPAPPQPHARCATAPCTPLQDALRARRSALEEILQEAKAQSAQRRLRRRQGVAAVCMALCVGLWAWNPVLRERTVEVAAGAPRAWTAHDGTIIALDGRSSLTLRLRLRSRAMRLDAGYVVLALAF